MTHPSAHRAPDQTMRQSSFRTPSPGGNSADDEEIPDTPQIKSSPSDWASRGSGASQAGDDDEAQRPMPPPPRDFFPRRASSEDSQDVAFTDKQPSAAGAGASRQAMKTVQPESDLGDTTTDYTESEALEGELPDDDIVGDLPQSSQASFQSNDVTPAVSAGNRYAALLTQNYRDLLRAVWKDEKDKRSALFGLPLRRWWEITIPLLATMPGPLLNEIIVGNIGLAARGTGPVADTLRFNKANNAKRPAIYNLVLVDQRSGEAPTPNELREMLEIMAKYPSRRHDQLAREIDTVILTQQPTRVPDLGKRKYLETKYSDISADRQKNVEVFREALTDRLDQIPAADADVPMARPLQQFGWTVDSRIRIGNHLQHESSNYIMGLTESIFRYLDRHHLPNRYRLDAYPICFLWEPEQAVAAEVLFTCIGDGYTENGGGFAHKNAGENNSSADTYNARLWEAQASFVSRTTPYFTNMKNERQRLEQDVAERKLLKENIRKNEDLISRSEEIRIAEKQSRHEFKRTENDWGDILQERQRLEQGILPPEYMAPINAAFEDSKRFIDDLADKLINDLKRKIDQRNGAHDDEAEHDLASGKTRRLSRQQIAASKPADEDPSIYDLPRDEDDTAPDPAVALTGTSWEDDETDYTGSEREEDADPNKSVEREEFK